MPLGKGPRVRKLVIAAAFAAVAALAGCSNGGFPTSAPPTATGPLGAATTPPAHVSLKSSCQLGWFAYNNTAAAAGNGGVSGNFRPGSAAHAGLPADEQPSGAFQVTLTNNGTVPAAVSWVNVDFYVNGRKVGNQTQQSDTADTIAPGQADSSWSAMFVPNEAEAKLPPGDMNATNGNMENLPGATCLVNQWGNAT